MSDQIKAAVHAAADALADYAVDTFWRTDSAFASSSRHGYKAAAAWLHQHAEGIEPASNPDDLVHLFAPVEGSLAACGETEVIQTSVNLDAVTCGWCRVDRHLTSSPAQGGVHRG